MSLGAENTIEKYDNNEIRLLHGGGGTRPMKEMLEEIMRSAPPMDPSRSELIYRRVMEKHQQRTERKRRWIRRMGRTVVSLMATLASSRAFRILTQ